MKRIFVISCCVLALALGNTAFASEDGESGAAVIADVVLTRPVCLAATVIGTAFFIVSLPLAIPSKSVKKTAAVLVTAPARATFTRPLGDLDALRD